MQERHLKRDKYFEEQVYTSRTYVLSFVEKVVLVNDTLKVLEIGCGEGGNLVPFLEKGCRVTGVDLVQSKIDNARAFFSEMENGSNATFICEDIYNMTSADFKFDLIIMRDVLEHIHNQDRFLHFLKSLLTEKGTVFFGFPPWQNPFGGHQQMCESKFLSMLPYFHILPAFMYRFILKLFGEKSGKIEGLLEIKETRISIDRFHKIIQKEGYKIEQQLWYLINPNYQIKFGLTPKKAPSFLAWIPYFRNYWITTCYYLIRLKG